MSLRNHSWNVVVKILTKQFGFTVIRQKGSHISLVDEDKKRLVVIPRHDPIKEHTLKSILDQAGIAKEDFIKYLTIPYLISFDSITGSVGLSPLRYTGSVVCETNLTLR